MAFVLVYGDHELALPLQFEAHIEEQLARMMGGSFDDSLPEYQRAQLAVRIVQAVTSMLDDAVVPPSEKQVKYAIAISRELSVQIPPTVLQDRDAMADFLTTHADTYRKRRAR